MPMYIAPWTVVVANVSISSSDKCHSELFSAIAFECSPHVLQRGCSFCGRVQGVGLKREMKTGKCGNDSLFGEQLGKNLGQPLVYYTRTYTVRASNLVRIFTYGIRMACTLIRKRYCRKGTRSWLTELLRFYGYLYGDKRQQEHQLEALASKWGGGCCYCAKREKNVIVFF